MRGREFKDAVFQQFARIASAFASPKRIELIDLLAQGERNVETLADETGLTVANTSRHLQILKSARLVESSKRGLQVFYRIAGPEVLRGYLGLQRLAEAHLAELERLVRDYFGDGDTLEPMDSERLLRRARAGEVTVIDVRPREEYESGHLPGAVSLPVKELADRLAELPRDRRIVAYCRSRYCVLADEAVQRLRADGYDAVRLAEGFLDLRQAGFPVETVDHESRKEGSRR